MGEHLKRSKMGVAIQAALELEDVAFLNSGDEALLETLIDGAVRLVLQELLVVFAVVGGDTRIAGFISMGGLWTGVIGLVEVVSGFGLVVLGSHEEGEMAIIASTATRCDASGVFA